MFPLPIQWVLLLPLLLLRLLLLLLLLLRPTLVVFAPSAAARLPALTYPAFCLSLTHLSSIVSHTLKFTAIIYAFYFVFFFFVVICFSYFVLFNIIIMVFFTLCVLCFCFFTSILSVMACTLFRTTTLLQTYSTYSYYCFAFHCV